MAAGKKDIAKTISQKKANIRESKRALDDMEKYFDQGIKKVTDLEKLLGRDIGGKDEIAKKIKEFVGELHKEYKELEATLDPMTSKK